MALPVIVDPKEMPDGKCRECHVIKSFDEFYFDKMKRNFRTARCKTCYSAYDKRNREKARNRENKRRKKYPEKQREKAKRQREKQKQSLQWQIERRIMCKVDRYARHGISRKIRSDTERVLGYTFERLREHIESQFTDGMNWELALKGQIDIDHIIPRCSFYYETTDDQDFKDCWALSNLRPMWKKDNLEKRDRMPDGSRGRDHGLKKKRLLDEECSVAGWEMAKTSNDDVFG